MYFYLPYVAFAQCACVGASTLFSVINEIPFRINFGANEAIFTHSFTDTWKIFAFAFTQILTSPIQQTYTKLCKMERNSIQIKGILLITVIWKKCRFRKCLRIFGSQLALAINAKKQYFRSIRTRYPCQRRWNIVRWLSLSCENLW